MVESCLYVSLVSADSFRRYTIIAENAIGIGRQRTVLTQRTCSVSFTEQYYFLILFCSLAVLDPRVGHTMDVLSPFISVLCHSD